MFHSSEKFQPRRKNDLFLIVSLIVLILFTTGFLWAALSRYRNRIEAISLSENRFLSTEWRLLEELRAQTDQKLLEKEQEIAELNQRYLRLARGNASTWELRQIETRLQQAREEREEILSRRTADPTDSIAEQGAWLKDLLPTESQATMNRLLHNRIEALETQLAESRAHIEAVETELEVLRVKQEAAIPGYDGSAEKDPAHFQELSSTVNRLTAAARGALGALTEKAREAEGRNLTRIEDLGTKALIRAIASSPAVRAEYPDLLGSLDRYFEVYGLMERREGRREAYAAALEILKPLAVTAP